MSFFDNFFKKKESKNIAKKRLLMALEIERASLKIDDIESMKKDLIKVVKKYIKVKDIYIKSNSNQNIDTLEVEIILDK